MTRNHFVDANGTFQPSGAFIYLGIIVPLMLAVVCFIGVMITGCDTKQQDLSEICAGCPAVGLSADVLTNNPNNGQIDEVKAEEVVSEINEAVSCPSKGFDAKKLDQIIIALGDHSNKNKFILWENTYGGGGEPDDIRVVYEYMGVHYTLWYNSTEVSMIDRGGEMYPVMHEGMISVWERPVGTYDDASIDTYTDMRFTGCVSIGIGHPSRNSTDRYRMLSNHDIGNNNGGVSYHKYWQNKYNQAIKGLEVHLGIR